MANELIFAGGESTPALPEGLDFGNDVTDEELDDAGTETGAADTADADTDSGDGNDDGADQGASDADSAESDDDADEQSDSEADGEEGAEDDQPVKGKPKGPAIPKARFDQALRKQRMAEQRAQELAERVAQLEQAQLEASAPKPLSTEEIQAKMIEANTALIAGETEKAAALQAEVLASLAKPAAPAQTPPPADDVVAKVRERMEFEQTLDEVFERFPELNDSADEFDEELAAESVVLQKSFIERGYSIPEATKKAAEYVARVHELSDRKAPVKAPSKAQAAAKAEQAAKTAAKIEKSVKAPPKVAGPRGEESEPAFDIFSASTEEFMALPQAVRDRLLGNTI